MINESMTSDILEWLIQSRVSTFLTDFVKDSCLELYTSMNVTFK